MKSKRKNKKIEIIVGILSIFILLGLILCGANTQILNQFSNILGINIVWEDNKQEEIETSNVEAFISDGNLKVYFIDVGQADSILIINGKQSMLIDTGNNEDGKDVVNFIKKQGIEKLNYVIGTHPHEDHIGGLDDVIDNIEVENIYMPKIETTTKTFEDVLDAIANKNLKVTAPNKGQTFQVGEARM